jgi:hypothetical protein
VSWARDRHIGGGMRVGVWASISMYRDGVPEQIDRCGNPFINPDGRMTSTTSANQPTTSPPTWALVQAPGSRRLLARGRRSGRSALPGILHYDRTKPAHYPSGRVPTDDVYSMSFAWLSHYKVVLTGLKPQDDLPATFPYLGSPTPSRGPPISYVPLSGRVPELAELDRLCETASSGAGGTVMVEGPPGIGKTRLLSEACARAADRGLIVVAGSADELDQVTPWAPLLMALSSSEPALLDPSLLGTVGQVGDQRFFVVEHMRSALEVAASGQPVLAALDDLQWADPSTLLALGLLSRDLFSYPVAWLSLAGRLPARRP